MRGVAGHRFVLLPLATLRKDVFVDRLADVVFNLQANWVDVELKLLDDRYAANRRERIPQYSSEDVNPSELVVDVDSFVFGDDLRELLLGTHVERIELFDDKSVGYRAILLANPRELARRAPPREPRIAPQQFWIRRLLQPR
jgi:hypothetical protein